MRIPIVLLLLFFGLQTFSQSGSMYSLQWETSIPTGNSLNTMEKNSYKGISFEYRRCFRNNIILGGRVAYNRFYDDKGLSTVEIDESTIYGYFTDYMNIAPIMVTGAYMFPSNKFVPYAGLGTGVYYIQSLSTLQSTDVSVSNNAWHFGVSPEVGVTIPFIISNFGLNLNAKYNFAVQTSSTPGYSWLSFGIGLSFMY